MANENGSGAGVKAKNRRGITEYNAGGRPTKYKNYYVDQLWEYFTSYVGEPDDDKIMSDDEREIYNANLAAGVGRVRRRGYPQFGKFALKLRVSPRTLRNWRERYPEFDEVCRDCIELQAEILKELGLKGELNHNVVRILLSAEHDIIEKKAVQADVNARAEIESGISDSDRCLLQNVARRLELPGAGTP